MGGGGGVSEDVGEVGGKRCSREDGCEGAGAGE